MLIFLLEFEEGFKLVIFTYPPPSSSYGTFAMTQKKREKEIICFIYSQKIDFSF